ncbi:MAG: radical SAM family heme chaperone HemW [Bacilli bacterium]
MNDTRLATRAPRSLYVHIPFCASKCFYCDFNSYVTGDAARSAYVDDLTVELRLLRDAFFGAGEKPPLDTIFFGGGTPTLLSPAQWRTVALTIHELFDIAPHCEWTAEANPGTVDAELLDTLTALGVNRLSFGAQTLNETLLQAIGRIHGADDVMRSIDLAAARGFARINVDLMLGLPDQTLQDVSQSLSRLLAAGVAHVSAYGLKVEDGTPFAKWREAGQLRLPDEDAEVAMYETARDILAAHGCAQYEISNFARPGQEARHNLVYWSNLPYLAAGAGAHGYVQSRRYQNERSLTSYGQRVRGKERPVAEVQDVTAGTAMEDTMMLGLRLQRGVSYSHFQALHGMEMREVFGGAMDRLSQQGVLLQGAAEVRIPPAYYGVANEIFAAFIGVCS